MTTGQSVWTDEGTVETAGGLLHYVEVGSGRPLILLPKLGGWVADFRHLAPALAESFRVIAVDPPGHGGSVRYGQPPYIIPIEESGRRLLGLMDVLGIEQAALGGNSLGGCIALAAASMQPARASHLVLISCATGGPLSHADLQRREQQQPSPDFDEQGNPLPRDPDEMARRNGTLNRQINDEMNQSRAAAGRWIQPSERGVGLADFPAMMRKVTAPVLLVYGERDPLCDSFEGISLESLPNGRSVRVPGSGRFPHQENPEGTVAALREFLGG